MAAVAETPVAIRAMTPEDIAFGMRLKEQARWNQIEADWRRLIEYEPQGVFVAELAGCSGSLSGSRATPVGTASAIRYGTRFGWIGMILVSPEFRRRGIATRLIGRCIEYLHGREVETIKLDATPAGRDVYLRLGFRDEWRLARFEGAACLSRDTAAEGDPAGLVEPMRAVDLDEVAAFDAPGFGADRSRVLARYLADWPEACRVLRRRGRIAGYCLARRGACADQVGPCVASAPGDDLALMTASMGAMSPDSEGAGRRVIADVVTENGWARQLVEALGFAEQRRFTRMALGPNCYRGDFSSTLLIAGPELG